METDQIIRTLIGWVVMALAISFAYKCYRASVEGKLTYWQGFLPISLVSPLLVHVPAKEGTLVKETTGMWVHLIMGPFFLILSVVLMAMGADLAGFAGTDTLNLILGGGNPLAPPSIVYNKNYNFSFPILQRTANKFIKSVNSYSVPIQDKDKLPGYQDYQDPNRQQ